MAVFGVGYGEPHTAFGITEGNNLRVTKREAQKVHRRGLAVGA